MLGRESGSLRHPAMLVPAWYDLLTALNGHKVSVVGRLAHSKAAADFAEHGRFLEEGVSQRCVYIGAGANLGDRLANLRLGLRRLGRLGEVVAVSSLYETAPVGVTAQPAFFNAVCALETRFGLEALLAELKQIEWCAGRRPGPRWGPRPLDLDILVSGDERIETPHLQVPHPRLAERAFVLVPLAELAPGLVVPGASGTVAALRFGLDGAGVYRVAGPEWFAAPQA